MRTFHWGLAVLVILAGVACTGPKGDRGDPGPAGETGAQGPKGETGDAGQTALDYVRITVVSPGASAAVSGTNLLAALGAVEGTADAPRVVFIEPGLYDVGGATVTVPAYVTLQGSGVHATRIVSTAEATGVRLEGGSVLRDVSFWLTGPSGTVPTAIACDGAAAVRTVQITLQAAGSLDGTTEGIRCLGGLDADALTLEATVAAGTLHAATVRGKVSVRRSSLKASGPSVVKGYVNDDGDTEWVDSQVIAQSESAAYGFTSFGTLEMRRGTVVAVGNSTEGMSLSGSAKIEHSTVDAAIGSYYAVSVENGTSSVTVLHSRILGGLNETIRAQGSTVRVGHSQLTGGTVQGTCYGCYNGSFQNANGIGKCP